MSVSRLLTLAGLAGTLLFQGCASGPAAVYVSNADSRSISVLSLDRAEGKAKVVQTVPVGGTVMPLATGQDKRTLYAALRSAPYAVAAFRIDRDTGSLTAAGSAPLPESMAYISTDREARLLFGASYGGHLLSVSPLSADGVPGSALFTLPTGKNAHAAVVSPDNRHLFVTNLGSDQVMQFRLDAAGGKLSASDPPVMPARAGSGPRHLVFHPNGRQAYLLGELDATVDLLDYNAAKGSLERRNHWSTLPPGFSGKPWAADLRLRPDGRFLYTTERTSSTIAVWRVDGGSGELTLVEHVATEKQPRGIQVDSSGRWLIAAGQLSHSVTVYRIDDVTGRLSVTDRIAVGQGPNWIEIVDLR